MRRRLGLALLLAVSAAHAADQAAPKKLVIIGDSLTEGYGVTREQAYPALLQKKIDATGKKWQVVNAGISGSTSASAVSRVRWQLKQKPDLILLALGANDGLRGLPTKNLEENLAQAVELARAQKVRVVLAGMKMPPNYGAKYTADFEAAFRHVAERYRLPFIPFLLGDVGGKSELNQSDGIHPNEKGHAVVAETVFRAITKEFGREP